ncbi:TPA: hypothetical protein I0H52_RS12925 [Enterococcus faecalis]|jgi:hypothetical protein|uniref:Uncharacterized protein n=1 Tax=Enterococcus faecalis TaxID=1351 RepID=A0A1W6QYD6_ENTFL|nr:hypothetical protein [Enterococcus faecalis]AFO45858.1 hypothetical protein EFD32_pB0074 [Enterococcus faecalis D32]ARO46313.1 hypothetical protein [Enterococcus faecalis]EGO8925790.1 hypothetical protein [Enterococcus faecalis]EPH81506.1 hypothetical protein D927_01405 [Enterococcus faecalis 02-MB-BW-10]EPH95096.1 hypothetical protein D921_01379 [Enterococcus faecalis F01966]
MDNTFEPIIKNKKKKSSLEEKHVAVKGNDDFSREASNHIVNSTKISNNLESANREIKQNSVDNRYKATMTQKISPSVNLKINTLKPFLGDLENMPKATVNDILNLLLDNYVNTKFSTRQQEAFNSMYNTQLELLKK